MNMILLKIKNCKINLHCIILFLIFSFDLNFFYLINTDLINLSDINIVLIFIWLLLLLLLNKFRINKKVFINFLFLFFGCFILAITSSLQSRELYTQSFWLGFRAQRLWIVFPIIYFILHSLLKNKRITFQQIMGTIYLFCIVELIIAFSQFLLYDYIDFTHVYTTTRYGDIRLYFDDVFLNLTLIYSFCQFIYGKNKKFNFIYILLVFSFHLILTKGRMVFATLLVTLFVILFFLSKINKKKRLNLIILSGFFLICILFTPMGQDIFNIIIGKIDNNTSEIRSEGRKFYFEVIKNYPLLGGGYINTLCSSAFEGAKMHLGIFITDNGLFGFMFEYGLLGISFLLFFYFIIMKKSILIYKKEKNTFLVGYIIFSVSGMLTLMNMGLIASLIIPIFFTLVCYEYEKVEGHNYAKQ